MNGETSDLPPLTPPPPPPKAKPRWLGRITAVFAWIYLVSVIGILIFIRREGDRWWPGTIVLLGPRWPVLLPLIVLLPLAAWKRRKMLMVLIVALLIGLFPIMGLSIPWQAFAADPASGPVLHVLTCNTHAGDIDGPQLASLIAETHPDIVCLQESKVKTLRELFADEQWHYWDLSEYMIASRYVIESRERLAYGGIRCVLEGPTGPITVFCVHLDSPHNALRDAIVEYPDGVAELEKNIALRRTQAEFLARQISQASGPVVIAGDFNLTTDSSIYLENLAQYQDAFEARGLGFGWTYHTLWTITRIDHILTNGNLICTSCRVGPNVGSPHKPVIAEFTIQAGH